MRGNGGLRHGTRGTGPGRGDPRRPAGAAGSVWHRGGRPRHGMLARYHRAAEAA